MVALSQAAPVSGAGGKRALPQRSPMVTIHKPECATGRSFSC